MDDPSHEFQADPARPNFAVPAIVFVAFTVGLAIALAVGRYPERAVGDEAAIHPATNTAAPTSTPVSPRVTSQPGH
jgi:hypothetical protein